MNLCKGFRSHILTSKTPVFCPYPAEFVRRGHFLCIKMGKNIDEGLSGTKMANRDALLHLLADCEERKIDFIVTKSISRFSRNTTECLQMVRKLLSLNVPVYFEKENINTMDASGEVLLTIMESLAQQESQSLSQNVRLGLQFRY